MGEAAEGDEDDEEEEEEAGSCGGKQDQVHSLESSPADIMCCWIKTEE